MVNFAYVESEADRGDNAAAPPYNHPMTHAFAGIWFYFYGYPQPPAEAWVRAT